MRYRGTRDTPEAIHALAGELLLQLSEEDYPTIYRDGFDQETCDHHSVTRGGYWLALNAAREFDDRFGGDNRTLAQIVDCAIEGFET